MSKLPRVYCEHCKYYYNKNSEHFLIYITEKPHQCGHPDNLVKKDDPIRPRIICRQYADRINRYNNCRNYKRIWYKFWIKGE
jgi:hypothetical protein